MKQHVTVVDAFTNKPFAGNPAAVCVLKQPADEAWMRAVAREMNHSETAFLSPGDDGYNLRWFTPTMEIELCGHATLASAHVLWEDGALAPDSPARFHTQSGLLTAARRGGWIEMDFPSTPETPQPEPEGLREGLGAALKYVGKTKFDYFVELATESEVRALRPNMQTLRSLPVRGVIVTARADGDTTAGAEPVDFISRYFAPAVGIDEDPVTGSAHCALSTFWFERFGRNELTGYQASARGGLVRVRVDGDRTVLSGHAVTVLRAELIAG